jgi:hypothetical protein
MAVVVHGGSSKSRSEEESGNGEELHFGCLVDDAFGNKDLNIKGVNPQRNDCA